MDPTAAAAPFTHQVAQWGAIGVLVAGVNDGAVAYDIGHVVRK